MPIETYRSPDRHLTFLVVAEAGDVSLGFEGCPWHTHADLLVAHDFAGAATVEALLAALQDDQILIALLCEHGVVRDIWLTTDPVEDQRRLQEGERLEHRFWSGKRWLEA